MTSVSYVTDVNFYLKQYSVYTHHVSGFSVTKSWCTEKQKVEEATTI